jgi:hypothetical protein
MVRCLLLLQPREAGLLLLLLLLLWWWCWLKRATASAVPAIMHN